MSADKPNVLVMMVDQMRSPRWFPESATLPAYERLKKEGASFTNSFASANPCSPSRANMVTGLHVTQHDVYTNVDMGLHMPGCPSLDARFPTYGHAFQKAGYKTPYFGKWHMTVPAEYEKEGIGKYGFEEWSGPDRDGFPGDGLRCDPQYADQTIAWLKENADNGPWCLTNSLINPHDIMFYMRSRPPKDCLELCDTLPANFEDDLSTKPKIQTHYQEMYGSLMGMTPDQPEHMWLRYLDFYYYLTKKMDDQIARILDTLDETGAAENTLVVFISDHGDMAGSHKLQAKGPFVYHENTQVPLIFRWPGHIAEGLETDALAHNVDLFPTIMDLAGIGDAPEYLAGKSLAPVLKGDGSQKVNDYILLTWDMSPTRLSDATSMGGPILATVSDINQKRGSVPGRVRAIFDGRYKYARYFDNGIEYQEFELYDLEKDPWELKNLADDAEYSGIRKKMAALLESAEQNEMAPIPWESLPEIETGK